MSPGSKLTLKSTSYLYSTLALKKGEGAVSKQLWNMSFHTITRERIIHIFKSYNTFKVIILSPFHRRESRRSKFRSHVCMHQGGHGRFWDRSFSKDMYVGRRHWYLFCGPSVFISLDKIYISCAYGGKEEGKACKLTPQTPWSMCILHTLITNCSFHSKWDQESWKQDTYLLVDQVPRQCSAAGSCAAWPPSWAQPWICRECWGPGRNGTHFQCGQLTLKRKLRPVLSQHFTTLHPSPLQYQTGHTHNCSC